jgi:hypothetical protein
MPGDGGLTTLSTVPTSDAALNFQSTPFGAQAPPAPRFSLRTTGRRGQNLLLFIHEPPCSRTGRGTAVTSCRRLYYKSRYFSSCRRQCRSGGSNDYDCYSSDRSCTRLSLYYDFGGRLDTNWGHHVLGIPCHHITIQPDVPKSAALSGETASVDISTTVHSTGKQPKYRKHNNAGTPNAIVCSATVWERGNWSRGLDGRGIFCLARIDGCCPCPRGDRQKRDNPGATSDSALVVSAVLAGLCWQRHCKSIRTAFRRIRSSWTRVRARLFVRSARPLWSCCLVNQNFASTDGRGSDAVLRHRHRVDLCPRSVFGRPHPRHARSRPLADLVHDRPRIHRACLLRGLCSHSFPGGNWESDRVPAVLNPDNYRIYFAIDRDHAAPRARDPGFDISGFFGLTARAARRPMSRRARRSSELCAARGATASGQP